MMLIRKRGEPAVYLVGLPNGAVPVEANDLAALETAHGATIELEPATFQAYLTAAGGPVFH